MTYRTYETLQARSHASKKKMKNIRNKETNHKIPKTNTLKVLVPAVNSK